MTSSRRDAFLAIPRDSHLTLHDEPRRHVNRAAARASPV